MRSIWATSIGLSIIFFSVHRPNGVKQGTVYITTLFCVYTNVYAEQSANVGGFVGNILTKVWHADDYMLDICSQSTVLIVQRKYE